MENSIQYISVDNVFDKRKYIVPIYQRNYAWGAKEICTLIDDINNVDEKRDDYFLGSIVFLMNDRQELEVIDGQQRLTTLYLLYRYFGNIGRDLPENFDTCLLYNSRPNYKKTLDSFKNANSEFWFDEGSQSLVNGYEIIRQEFDEGIKNGTITIEQFTGKFEKIFMLLVAVPHDTNLNHYFEIMNTRGEQLEQHEILKNRIYSKLDNATEKALFAKIWDSCSNTGRYIQVGFTEGSPETRNKIFGNNWDKFIPENFDELCGLFNPVENSGVEEKISIFDETKDTIVTESDDNDDLDNFQPMITFPSLLLHCKNIAENDNEGGLNDGELLKYFPPEKLDKDRIKGFAYSLLKVRFFLDNYMIHREKDNQEEDEFVVKCGYKTDSGGFAHKNPFSNDDEDYNDDTTRKIIMIQSCLRVSYTSPKQMHWITSLLKAMFKNCAADNIIQTGENYFRDKLCAYFKNELLYFGNTKFMQAYQELPRIIYFYLDYLLWRDGYCDSEINLDGKYKKDFKFMFRSPIDHFNHLDDTENYNYAKTPEETKWKHSFGNLSCITTNLNLREKSDRDINFSYKQLLQSPKLYIMAKIKEKNNNKFDENKSNEHGNKMFKILLNNINGEPDV